MTDCEFLEKCPFFNDKLTNMPTASDMMKKMYCKWNHTKCARFKIATTMGRSAVPNNMFPSDTLRADELLIQFEMK